MMKLVFGCMILVASLSKVHSQNVARISAVPPVSNQTVADLEARVGSNPGDLEDRIALLQLYAGGGQNIDPGRRIARLGQILYLIDHHPEVSALATPIAYVARARGDYANPDDHQMALHHWRSAVDSHPGNASVIMNALRFLAVEDKNDAEDVLKKALAADPENREIAANLGFLYAIEILGLDSLALGTKPSGVDSALAAHATAALERSSNPIVLAGAGTAIPNLAVKANADTPQLFELASTLSARARQLAPGDQDIQGPMPLIRYFAAAHETPAGNLSPPVPPVRIQSSFQVMRKTAPVYPEAAKSAGIKGTVRFRVVVGRDGTVTSLQLIDGHPLLVAAALHAVETWTYTPVILNDNPVEIITEVTVTFPPD